MNKEHVFQIGISVDEDEIMNGINEQVKNTLVKKIEDRYLEKGVYGYGLVPVPTDYLKSLVDNKLVQVLDDNKEEIIKAAGEILAEKLFKTKLAKETLKRVTESGGANE